MNYDIIDMLITSCVIEGLSGRLGDNVFYMRGGKICARRHVIPANPRTKRQQARRGVFAAAVRRWRSLTDAARMEWNGRAGKLKCSGYNLFIRDYLRRTAEAAPGKPPSTIRSSPVSRESSTAATRETTASPPRIINPGDCLRRVAFVRKARAPAEKNAA